MGRDASPQNGCSQAKRSSEVTALPLRTEGERDGSQTGRDKETETRSKGSLDTSLHQGRFLVSSFAGMKNDTKNVSGTFWHSASVCFRPGIKLR